MTLHEESKKLDKKIAAVRKELGEVSICCGAKRTKEFEGSFCDQCGKPFVPHPRKQLPANSEKISTSLAVRDTVDKMDAEVMEWHYSVCEANFGAEMYLQDSSDLRKILAENIEEIISSTRSSVLREVEGAMTEARLKFAKTAKYSLEAHEVWNKAMAIDWDTLQTLKKLQQ